MMNDCVSKLTVKWEDYGQHLATLAKMLQSSGNSYDAVFGVPRGGLPVAVYLSHHLGIPMLPSNMSLAELVEHRENRGRRILIAEDIVDTGRTADPYLTASFDIASVFLKRPIDARLEPKYFAVVAPREVWVVYPYETE
jgi:hypoxanthine phosphoribosyltransferase